MKTPEKRVVEHLAYFLTKAENLIALKKEYREVQVQSLLNHIREHPSGPILFKRIGHNSKTLFGKVENITEGGFWIISNESFTSSGIYEEPQKNYVRFDNVLGWIPFLPSTLAEEMDPYENHICKETKDCFIFLAEAKELFRECLHETHKATICLRYYGSNKKETIDCRINVVNESNLNIEQYCSKTYKNGTIVSVACTKQERTILYIGLECYIQKTEITFGEEHNISCSDDGETF